MTENKYKQANVNDTVQRTQTAGGNSDVRIENVRLFLLFTFLNVVYLTCNLIYVL